MNYTTTVNHHYCRAFQMFYAAGRWDLCSSFSYNTCHDWKKYNQSQLGKGKKRPALIYLTAKQLSFRCFCFENGSVCFKSKTKEKAI